jgi:uncharacterized membrane protein YdjX (TVP38/TMEM64 family)
MQPGKPSAARRRLAPLLAVALIVLAALVLRFIGIVDFRHLAADREFLVGATARLGFAAAILYALLYAATAALSLPISAAMSIFAGFLFGTLVGTATAVTGATIGAGLVFILARTAFGDAWRRRAGPAVRRFEAGFRSSAFFYLLALRLLPIFPFWLVNLAPAFLGVRLRVFLAATFIGIIPATLVYVSLGTGVGAVLERGEQPDLAILLTPQILVPLVALALLALVPVAYKMWRGGGSMRGGAMEGGAMGDGSKPGEAE